MTNINTQETDYSVYILFCLKLIIAGFHTSIHVQVKIFYDIILVF